MFRCDLFAIFCGAFKCLPPPVEPCSRECELKIFTRNIWAAMCGYQTEKLKKRNHARRKTGLCLGERKE